MNKLQPDVLPAGESYLAGLKEVLSTAWPASLTMLNGTIMGFVDGLMVARVGAVSLNAQFISGIFCFVLEAFFMGILGVVNTFVAQNYGARRRKITSEYVRAGVVIAWAGGLLVVPLAIFAPQIFSLFSDSTPDKAELVALETIYFRFFILTLGIRLTNVVLSEFFFGIHRQRVVLLASTVSTVCNIILNYILIYGNFGFPAMGLKGAAIGSVISFGVYTVIIANVYFSPAIRKYYGSASSFRFKFSRLMDLLRIGWPSGLQFFSDVVCWFIFTGIIIQGYFGQDAVTATAVALRYMHFSFMPTVGLSIATTALVGKYIGEKRKDLVRRRVSQARLLAMIYMGCCGLIFFLFREPLAELFVVKNSATSNVDVAETIKLAKWLLICAAGFQIFDAVAITYNGALRGAGDTKWQMLISIMVHWPLVVGGGWLVAELLPAAGAVGPWLAATVFIIVLAVALGLRFEIGPWEKIDLLGPVSVPVTSTQLGEIELLD